ncbi:hypothetical protein BRADI_3g45450v3 [Brachypodium distachyon]|uniref:Uncharacterized protein n=2 Tax=Brachypodium distachyon TaxID=15368 RepID=I1IAE3_BRADI|nr:hypothetical protein BRADI_3g45450v3 [Brachypodium distachyon]
MAAALPATGRGKRKRDFSEDDVFLILYKYAPATILTALQEVAQHTKGRKIDWRALVAKTTTGITSAREYQMLWRHFAYGHEFVENVDDSAQPLGDDSDLECEIEPVPTPRNEDIAEASGFAKLLLYGSSREQASSHRVNSEVPVQNTPKEKIPRVPSDKQLNQSHRLTNGTGPVSNLKQTSQTGLSLDPFDGNGPHKKKKKPKPWSKEEDADLTTGVQKCGEGNWLDILHKYNFDNTRTPVQLSQRWALICKRQGITKPANAKPVTGNLDKEAAQKAFSLAIGMPIARKAGSSTSRSGASQQSSQHPLPVFGTTIPELKPATASSSLPVSVPGPVTLPVPVHVQQPLPQILQVSAQAPPLKVSNTSSKSRNNKKQGAQQNPVSAPSSIQAAAIAAGGRIATQSDATNFLKVARSTKAVHIRSQGTGSAKISTGSKASTVAGEPGTQLGSAQHPEPPNSSAPTPSPPVLTTHATEQVNVVSELTVVNHPEQSAGAHLLETNSTLNTMPLSGPCDNVEMDDDSTFCVVTMEDLFPEDVKQPDIVDLKAEEIIDPKDADMLEFDRFVAQGCLNMDYVDKSKNVKIAPEAQGGAGSQKRQLKQLSAVGKSIPVFSRAAATGKKTKTLGPNVATFPATGTSSGLIGTGNAGVLSKAVWGKTAGLGTTGKQNRCQEIMAQKQHTTNSKGNGVPKNAVLSTGTAAKNMAPTTGTPARNVAPGTTGTPARNVALVTGTPARNSALGTGTSVRNVSPGSGTPANRHASPAANGSSKGNPPAAQ